MLRLTLALTSMLTLLGATAGAAGLAEMVDSSGVCGGVVVHLGCGDGHGTLDLYRGDSFVVQGLDTSGKNVATARQFIRAHGKYGPVSVKQFDGRSLPYADNSVNLIIGSTLGAVAPQEALRVLAPLGAMIIDGNKTIKPWPAAIDDWPQYLNKADNNAVARDQLVGPPRFLQWTDTPVWCRSHMGAPTVASLVTSHGRMYTIEDSAPPDNPFLPAAFRIVARDAFNGKQLWQRPLKRWESVTMYIKCQPTQQQRRLVAVGDRLYCTLQLEGPVSVLDATNGKLLKTYEQTSPTQEVAYADGILYLNVGDRFDSAAYNIVKTKNQPYVEGVDPDGPFYGAGFRRGYAPQIKDKPQSTSRIVAMDAQTGQRLWTTENVTNYTAASLAISGQAAVYQAADGLFCVDAKTGVPTWSVRKPIASAVGHDSQTPGTLPNTVVIAAGKVFAVEGRPGAKVAPYADNTLNAYSLADGKLLWQAPARGCYESSSDVFYVNGSVWVGGQNPTQYDAETGEQVKKIVQRMTGPMGHDRCYRNLITEHFFINSKTGGADFLNLESGQELPNHWTRGGCGMGVLPANGLLYSTPYSCQCSMGSMYQGMHAYASPGLALRRSDQPIRMPAQPRLRRGPAYGMDLTAADKDAAWPTYRRDGSRSGTSPARVANDLRLRWSTKLPSRPSATTIANGCVFVSAVDTHTVFALDSQTGKQRWSFTAGARVDSPPTVYRGALFFGCRDGWIYCVRAADGQLAWRFKDLPDRQIGAYGQLESKWPIAGSVVVVNDTVYCAAGRSSYLDGGIFLYALDPKTGKVRHRRGGYGPFDETSGFPVGGDAGFKNDVLVTDGKQLYLRQRAFQLDLTDGTPATHIIPSAGFLDGQPQHRTGWGVGSGIGRRSLGDILVASGKTYYDVWGFPLWANHSYFDPRRNGYTLYAHTVEPQAAKPASKRGKRGKRQRGPAARELWRCNIPITGKAMALAGQTLFVAGEPMKFDDPSYQNYVAAYDGKLGGQLVAVAVDDHTQTATHKLSAAPVWDGLSVGNGCLVVSLADGTVECLGD